MQRDLDERLNVLLKDSPRRSVLMIDSEKTGVDGGCVNRLLPSHLAILDKCMRPHAQGRRQISLRAV